MQPASAALLFSPQNYIALPLNRLQFEPATPHAQKSFIYSKIFLVRKTQIGVYNLHEDTHGRRHITYVQRLRAGLYLHRCRSGVLPGTWLFDPEALQELPSGKEARPGGLRLPFCSGHRNTCDLFGLRPAYNSAF